MRTVTIEVTQEDIDNGVPLDIDRCPVALAVKRSFPNDRIVIDGFQITLVEKYRMIILPAFVREAIHGFDQIPSKGMEPFSFTIEVEE